MNCTITAFSMVRDRTYKNIPEYIYIEKIGCIKRKQAWGGGGDTMGNDY